MPTALSFLSRKKTNSPSVKAGIALSLLYAENPVICYPSLLGVMTCIKGGGLHIKCEPQGNAKEADRERVIHRGSAVMWESKVK